MLERLLPWWAGKLFVLVLLGFAATDFLITMTLSAADATRAPAWRTRTRPAWLHGRALLITLVLLAALGAVFLRGFTEAIGIAVVLVGVYLALNVVVVGVSLAGADHARAVADWTDALTAQHANPLADRRRGAAGLPQAGAGPVRLRDRRRGDAAGRGRPGRHRARPGRADPRHAPAAAHRCRWS